MWKCSRCRIDNDGWVKDCSMCGAVNPEWLHNRADWEAKYEPKVDETGAVE